MLDAFELKKVGVKGIRRRCFKKETIVEHLNEVRMMDLEGKSLSKSC